MCRMLVRNCWKFFCLVSWSNLLFCYCILILEAVILYCIFFVVRCILCLMRSMRNISLILLLIMKIWIFFWKVVGWWCCNSILWWCGFCIMMVLIIFILLIWVMVLLLLVINFSWYWFSLVRLVWWIAFCGLVWKFRIKWQLLFCIWIWLLIMVGCGLFFSCCLNCWNGFIVLWVIGVFLLLLLFLLFVVLCICWLKCSIFLWWRCVCCSWRFR